MASLRPVRATIDVPWAGRSIRRLRGLAWLAIITATVAFPASAFGATAGGGGGGDGQVTEPGGNMLGIVLGVAVALATIAVALAVLIGLAYVVARIGGPPVAPASEPGSTGPDRSRSAIGTTVSVLVAIGALVVDVLAERDRPA